MGLAGVLVSAGVASAQGQNLIVNPGFESGNTGFASDYSYSAGGNCCEGEYTVRSNGSSFNRFFTDPPPSSPGSTLMMVINGSTTPGLRMWRQTVSVSPGVRYNLSLRGATAVAGGPAILQWQLGGALIGASTTLPNTTQLWIEVGATWTAPPGVTSIEVAVRNLNTSTFPNDFYIDDIAMVNACPVDFNGDGFLDFFDYDDYVECFETGNCPPGTDADFNRDGFVDFFDYDAFVAAFEAGC